MKSAVKIQSREIRQLKGIRIPVIRYDVYEEGFNGRTTEKLSDKGFNKGIAEEILTASVDRQSVDEEIIRRKIMIINNEMMCIDTWLLTDEYPFNTFDEITWKLLLHLYRMVDINTGIVDICYRSFNKVYECEAEEYFMALKEIEFYGLICNSIYEDNNVIMLLLSPENHQIVFSEHPEKMLLFKKTNLDNTEDAYEVLRKDLFDKAFRELRVEEFRLLLLLSKKQNHSKAGEVDSDYIRHDNYGEIIISGDLICDMGLGEEAMSRESKELAEKFIVQMLVVLEKNGYICFKSLVIGIEQFVSVNVGSVGGEDCI